MTLIKSNGSELLGSFPAPPDLSPFSSRDALPNLHSSTRTFQRTSKLKLQLIQLLRRKMAPNASLMLAANLIVLIQTTVEIEILTLKKKKKRRGKVT